MLKRVAFFVECVFVWVLNFKSEPFVIVRFLGFEVIC